MLAWRQHKPLLSCIRIIKCGRVYSTLRDPSDINEVLSKPTWSVRDTLSPNNTTSLYASSSQAEEITRSKLHHLLRLSALPLPSSEAEEDKLMKDLRRQLEFVRSIQTVDTEGVEPLVAIRDERQQASQDSEIGLEDPAIKKALQQEKRVGKRGRIVNIRDDNSKGDSLEWDPLAQAGRKVGKYIAVDTAKD